MNNDNKIITIFCNDTMTVNDENKNSNNNRMQMRQMDGKFTESSGGSRGLDLIRTSNIKCMGTTRGSTFVLMALIQIHCIIIVISIIIVIIVITTRESAMPQQWEPTITRLPVKPQLHARQPCCSLCGGGKCCAMMECCKLSCCLLALTDNDVLFSPMVAELVQNVVENRFYTNANANANNNNDAQALGSGVKHSFALGDHKEDDGFGMKKIAILERMKLRVKIAGITCADCVTLIEGKLSSVSNVVSVRISVMTGIGDVVFHQSSMQQKEDAESIVALINQLGFTTTIIRLISDEADSATTAESDDARTVKLNFKLSSFTESSTNVKDIPVQVKAIAGVEECLITFSRDNQAEVPIISIDYDPSILGARALHSSIMTLHNGPVEVIPITSSNMGDEMRAIWSTRLWISLILAIPIILLVYILPEVSSSIDDGLNSEITTGLSVLHFVTWILSTPMQFYVAIPLYVSAYRVFRYAHTCNIDTLVVLSSSCAYFYSLVTVILSMAGKNFSDDVFFETNAILIALIIAGRYLEAIAKGKAVNSVNSLATLQVPFCSRIPKKLTGCKDKCCDDGCASETDSNSISTSDSSELDFQQKMELPIQLIERGDVLQILPGSRIPTDGIVINGSSNVDESMLTGESLAVPKFVGSVVYGGTTNEHGELLIEVQRVPGENMLSEIIQLVQNAQNSKPEIQRYADQVASIFVPVIILLSVSVFILWFLLAYHEVVETHGKSSASMALQFALATLVVSCPCAIGLACPTAIVVGCGAGAKLGILFKSSPAIESCFKIDTIIFDKTGTLTKGQASVSNYKILSSAAAVMDDRKFWWLVGSLQSHSEHVLAKAAVSFAEQQQQQSISWAATTDFLAIPGRGIEGTVDKSKMHIGNLEWMLENKIKILDTDNTQTKRKEKAKSVAKTCKSNTGCCSNDNVEDDAEIETKLRAFHTQLESTIHSGSTVVYVANDNILIGWIALNDSIRDEAIEVLKHLNQLNIEVHVLSGDNQKTCDSVGARLGIPSTQVYGNMLPADKAAAVKAVMDSGKYVAFVGDGINDSVAISTAHVGIAMASGQQITHDAADVVLTSNDLRSIVNMAELSRATFHRIFFNFCWAFVYNLVAIPFAVGLLYPWIDWAMPPGFAGLSELFSSIPVVISSVLLKYFTPSYQVLESKNSPSFFASSSTSATTSSSGLLRSLGGSSIRLIESAANQSSASSHLLLSPTSQPLSSSSPSNANTCLAPKVASSCCNVKKGIDCSKETNTVSCCSRTAACLDKRPVQMDYCCANKTLKKNETMCCVTVTIPEHESVVLAAVSEMEKSQVHSVPCIPCQLSAGDPNANGSVDADPCGLETQDDNVKDDCNCYGIEISLSPTPSSSVVACCSDCEVSKFDEEEEKAQTVTKDGAIAAVDLANDIHEDSSIILDCCSDCCTSEKSSQHVEELHDEKSVVQSESSDSNIIACCSNCEASVPPTIESEESSVIETCCSDCE